VAETLAAHGFEECARFWHSHALAQSDDRQSGHVVVGAARWPRTSHIPQRRAGIQCTGAVP
jgi:hypothetical protein